MSCSQNDDEPRQVVASVFRHPPTSHPDSEAVACYAEGLLDAGRASEVSSHVSSCAQCQATLRQLDEVSAALSTASSPSIPADVSARLDATLAHLRADRGMAMTDR